MVGSNDVCNTTFSSSYITSPRTPDPRTGGPEIKIIYIYDGWDWDVGVAIRLFTHAKRHAPRLSVPNDPNQQSYYYVLVNYIRT